MSFSKKDCYSYCLLGYFLVTRQMPIKLKPKKLIFKRKKYFELILLSLIDFYCVLIVLHMHVI